MPNHTRKNQKKSTKIIGKIYANWCGYCIALKPEWDKMKQELKNHPIEFIEIEASEQKRLEDFKKKHGIQVNGYPTIFKIAGGVEYFQGSRDTESLTQWALSDTMKGGFKRRNRRNKSLRNKHNKTFKTKK
jgi:thiol-disulfide isomerase/thioredoxin